jgi:hypothetical protein
MEAFRVAEAAIKAAEADHDAQPPVADDGVGNGAV